MTVVSALKFNKNRGAMIADERLISDEASSMDEKHDVDIKLYELPLLKNVVGVIGGSGSSEEIYSAFLSSGSVIKSKRASIRTGRDMAEQVSRVVARLRRQVVDAHFFNKYGLLEANYHTGKRKGANGKLVDLDEDLWNNIKDEYESDDLKGKIDNEFLMMTSSKEGVRMYRADMDMVHPYEVELMYDSIGSGGGKAGEVLCQFVRSFPRQARRELPHLEGMEVLLRAYEHSTVMSGVGGTPLIKIVKDGVILTPSHENSKLAAEIVKGARFGELPESFELNSLDELLYKSADSWRVEEEMWALASNPRRLSRLLRDYPQRSASPPKGYSNGRSDSIAS